MIFNEQTVILLHEVTQWNGAPDAVLTGLEWNSKLQLLWGEV